VIDTHAHVHDKAFDRDRRAVVERASESGVSEIVTVGCDIADSLRAVACAREFGLYATVGIHPHEAKDAPADIEAAFAPLLDDARVVAIGETGLDYYYDHSPRDAQERCLRQQLQLARKRNMPVVFHHRDAFADFVRILEEEWRSGMRGVVHCFTGTIEQAGTYVDRFGLKLGAGGVITFRTAQAIRDGIAAVGAQNCVLETDCPYLAPVPRRGERNEPAFVIETARVLAQIVRQSLDAVLEITDDNARQLFGLPLRDQRVSVLPS